MIFSIFKKKISQTLFYNDQNPVTEESSFHVNCWLLSKNTKYEEHRKYIYIVNRIFPLAIMFHLHVFWHRRVIIDDANNQKRNTPHKKIETRLLNLLRRGTLNSNWSPRASSSPTTTMSARRSSTFVRSWNHSPHFVSFHHNFSLSLSVNFFFQLDMIFFWIIIDVINEENIIFFPSSLYFFSIFN